MTDNRQEAVFLFKGIQGRQVVMNKTENKRQRGGMKEAAS
jgi:hypothetical protein